MSNDLNDGRHPELDVDFESYLVEKPSLTYVQSSDSFIRRFVINRLEVFLGRRKLEDIYHRLKDEPFELNQFFQRAVVESGIDIEYRGLKPDQIRNVDGPIIFVANHPFGILDGMVLCHLAAEVRGDLRILINAVLCQDRDLAPFFLPVDFDATQKAIRTNIKSKRLALKNLSENVPVLIFPSGMVSTASKLGFGSVKDAPWTTFAAKLVRESKANVVPVYFHGQNSRSFHIASHLAEPLRMGMLMHEAKRKFGGAVPVTIGEPIAWSELEEIQGRQQLTDVLYASVQALRSANKDGDDATNPLRKLIKKVREHNKLKRARSNKNASD